MDKIERVIVHHSASPRSTTYDQILEWHTRPTPDGRGWSDIAYHYIIEENGGVRFGRLLPTTGAHARGANSTSIGICITGNNTVADQAWNLGQHGALRGLLGAIATLWPDLPVVGHRDAVEIGATVCPGVDIAMLLRG